MTKLGSVVSVSSGQRSLGAFKESASASFGDECRLVANMPLTVDGLEIATDIGSVEIAQPTYLLDRHVGLQAACHSRGRTTLHWRQVRVVPPEGIEVGNFASVSQASLELFL